MSNLSAMLKGRQQKGGIQFGPKSSAKGGAFGGGYGAGTGPTNTGFLGPAMLGAPTKQRKTNKNTIKRRTNG